MLTMIAMSEFSLRASNIEADKIPFGRPSVVGHEMRYIAQAIENGSIAGGGPFMRRCEIWLEEKLPARHALMTHSCTAALEMSAMLTNIGPGDEVIMPSFTFSSTATAFVLRGATPVFVDVRRDTLNIDESLIEAAITRRTRAIVPVHYAGLAGEMDAIMAIAARYDLLVVEDAAQAHLSEYKGKALGTIGHVGCLSFHETKNIISGEGGALLVNDPSMIERAEILREKGTDRSRFFRGEVDKYTWRDIGSSYCPGEIVSAFLYAQFERAEWIIARRRAIYDAYREGLAPLAGLGYVTLPAAPGKAANGHIFWLLTNEPETRGQLLRHMSDHQVHAVFHYVPLHSAPAGVRYGRKSGDLRMTDDIAARLVRLPMYVSMTDAEIARVIAAVGTFFGRNR
jgi:dTDP-4-amino-4,6-dideoxygalactose transaminase